MLWYTKTIIFGQRPKSSSTSLSKIRFLFMMAYVVELNTQMWKIKLRSSILIIRSVAQSKWLSLVLDIDFMTLTILKFDFSIMFLDFIIYLRVSSQNFVEDHQFNFVLSYFK